MFLLQITQVGQERTYDIPYSVFKERVKQQRVIEVVLKGQIAEGKLDQPQPIGPRGEVGQRFRTRIPAWMRPGESERP